ncbi:MAG: MazG nucleotide pyrophosphohydrolase domain-containing protein [Candidatus Thorarchaeota archaeon]
MNDSKTFQDFQKLMQTIFFERDKKRGVSSTFIWLIEEIGELAKAIRKNDSDNIREEFADVFAWLCSLANLSEINLLEVAFEKYPGFCPRCRQKKCKCT